MKITGTLYSETDAQTTRVYWSEEYNLQLVVAYAFDRQFLLDSKKKDSSGFYFLLWKHRDSINNFSAVTTQIEYIEQIYIGQTKNVNQRVIQHLDRGKNFELSCMFTRLKGKLTQTQTTYLEYLAIKEALECGQVFVMENYQIPKKPNIEPKDEREMNELFGIIKVMLSYAGFDEIYRKKQLSIRNEDYSIHRKRTMLDRIVNKTQHSNVGFVKNPSTVKQHVWCCCEDISSSEDDEEYDDFESNDPSVFSRYDYEDEEVLVSYKAIDADGKYNAYIIPVSTGYMIMPGSVINQEYEKLSEIGDQLNIEDISNKVKLNENRRISVSVGFILPSLEDMSLLVNNDSDTKIWQMLRQFTN